MSITHLSQDTIAAIATPSGRGGIAIVRVSGALVPNVMQNVLKKTLTPRVATHTPFYDEQHDIIDEGIAIYFAAPNSFTGEDVLELHGHGGPVVVDLLLSRLLKEGARLARPGEFSERAFLNNKLDLTQAEAIADLIDASSQQAAKLAVKSLQGEFSKIVHAISEKIIHLRMYVESAIDFSDEAIDFLAEGLIEQKIKLIAKELKDLQDKSKQGSFLREGITVVIAGVPNVGKSSLINCLSQKEIAIVTDVPGTTRDVIRDHILIDDVPLHIIDTAGLRDTHDVVEQEGIKRAYHEISQADLILYLIDQKENVTTISKHFHCPVIFIRNKIDLQHQTPQLQIEDTHTIVSISAKFSLGIDLLKSAIKNAIGFQSESEGIFLARRRHLEALQKAYQYIENSLHHFSNIKATELIAEDLRLAHLRLAEITGEFTADDLLGKIFANFCIGK